MIQGEAKTDTKSKSREKIKNKNETKAKNQQMIRKRSPEEKQNRKFFEERNFLGQMFDEMNVGSKVDECLACNNSDSGVLKRLGLC
jgi:hypothetical protein